MYAESSAHPEVNKDKDSVVTAYPEVPEDLDADSSFLPEVPENNEVLGEGARDEVNTYNTSYYDTRMDLYISNIYKNENNTWRTIYVN